MVSANAADPRVSVIVPTYNRRERLARLLAGLDRAHEAGARFETVVVVDGAVDGTADLLAATRTAYPLLVHTQPNAGPAAARNRALAAASGDVVLFLDDDVVPSEDLIERHLSVHRSDTSAVVIGAMVAPPGCRMPPWLSWEAAMLQKQYAAMIAGHFAPTPRQFYTANASVRRDHALSAGGFDESFRRAEDVEFAYRLADRGLRFYFEPRAIVVHEPDRTLRQWLKVAYEYGRYDVALERDHGRGHIRIAHRERAGRHFLNRLLPRCCAGHRLRMGVAVAIAGSGLRYAMPGPFGRLQHAMCSALANIEYWHGVARGSGLGARVWQDADAGLPGTLPQTMPR
ncbi:MAG: glycosyltransferase family 2 protein [Chloroflexi bacterium]|nr:glycosyltransferase family 2 protein [Chloroflexota bacterium]